MRAPTDRKLDMWSTSDSFRLPQIDFMIIGAPRCATTWLSDCLRENPSVFMPEEELNFWLPRSGLLAPWYKKRFKNSEGNLLVGENSSLYLGSVETAKKIRTHYPDIKAIAILRDPFERAISHYRMRKANGFYPPDLSFRAACEVNDFSGRGLVRLSKYASGLKIWLDHFGSEKLKIIFYEDVREKPLKTFQAVSKFLGIRDEFVPQCIRETPGSAGRIEPRISARVIRKIIQHGRVSFGPLWPYLRHIGRRTGMKKFVRTLSVREVDSVQDMPDSEVEEWFREMVKADVIRVEQLLNVNLNHWKPE